MNPCDQTLFKQLLSRDEKLLIDHFFDNFIDYSVQVKYSGSEAYKEGLASIAQYQVKRQLVSRHQVKTVILPIVKDFKNRI